MESKEPSWWPEIAILFVFLALVAAGALMILGPYQPPPFYTINHSLSRVNPGPTPLPTPSPVVIPEIPPSVLAQLGDFGIISQEPCGPPCFLGIRPGVTSFDEAAAILDKAGIPCTAMDIQPSGKGLGCGPADPSITVATVGLCTRQDDGVHVGGIVLRPPVKITLGEFSAQYGLPESVTTGGTEVWFPYKSVQTFVFVRPAQSSSTITRDTPIDMVIYMTAAEYAQCKETGGNGQPGTVQTTTTPIATP